MNPRPTRDELDKFAGNFVRNDNLDLFDLYRRGVLRREALAIQRLKPQGSLLDVGCATGVFFEMFRPEAWQLHGVETSQEGATRARVGFGANVFTGTLRAANYAANSFDVVSILDTIYYFSDPLAELREVHRILRRDGLLAIEIPGLTYTLLRGVGPISLLLDRVWSRLRADSWHLYYFAPLHLRILLERAGFRVVRVIPGQASLGRGGLYRALNTMHFRFAQAIHRLSFGRISVAGKELYLAVKT